MEFNSSTDAESLRGYKKLLKESYYKTCFIDDTNCNKLIHSHSIQNNRILTKIAENGNVMMFSFYNTQSFFEDITMMPVGRAQATTFPGFCKFHDQILFKPIENFDYCPENREQEFLFAFRALAHEYNNQQNIYLLTSKLYNMCLTGDVENLKKVSHEFLLINKDFNSDLLKQRLEGLKFSLKCLNTLRTSFIINLKNKRFDRINTYFIELHNEYNIAVSSMFSMSNDLSDFPINNFFDLKNQASNLFLTIFPQNKKTYILFSCLSKEKEKYRNMFIQFQELAEEQKKEMVTNIILSYVENFVLSPKIWSLFSSEEKEKMNSVFTKTANLPEIFISRIKDFNLFKDI